MNYYRKRRKTFGTGKVVTWLLVAFLVISMIPLLVSYLGRSPGADRPTEPPGSVIDPPQENVPSEGVTFDLPLENVVSWKFNEVITLDNNLFVPNESFSIDINFECDGVSYRKIFIDMFDTPSDFEIYYICSSDNGENVFVYDSMLSSPWIDEVYREIFRNVGFSPDVESWNFLLKSAVPLTKTISGTWESRYDFSEYSYFEDHNFTADFPVLVDGFLTPGVCFVGGVWNGNFLEESNLVFSLLDEYSCDEIRFLGPQQVDNVFYDFMIKYFKRVS